MVIALSLLWSVTLAFSYRCNPIDFQDAFIAFQDPHLLLGWCLVISPVFGVVVAVVLLVGSIGFWWGGKRLGRALRILAAAIAAWNLVAIVGQVIHALAAPNSIFYSMNPLSGLQVIVYTWYRSDPYLHYPLGLALALVLLAHLPYWSSNVVELGYAVLLFLFLRPTPPDVVALADPEPVT